MNNEEAKDLYKQALSKWGTVAQVMMTIEECSELIDALCKSDRHRVNEDAVITEIADVMIMCGQMSILFGEELVEKEKDKKLERLKQHLNG